MRSLILASAAASMCLSSCAAATHLGNAINGIGGASTQLPESFIKDDQLGISVELAYQAASLAERTAVKAGFVTGPNARALIKLDNDAYDGVCYYRTAYDVANGRDPKARDDGCRAATKSSKFADYASAGRYAIAMIQGLVNTTKAYQR